MQQLGGRYRASLPQDAHLRSSCKSEVARFGALQRSPDELASHIIATVMSIPNHPASSPDIPALRARALSLRRKMMAMASGKGEGYSFSLVR